jgi:heptosyltransferase-2
VVALAPGAVGPSKRWPAFAYAEVARQLTAQGVAVWVVGGPSEKQIAGEIIGGAGPLARDLTGTDLRGGILALAAAEVAVSNDSGLLHVAAALGTPAVGIFGPTSPWHWAPLNPIAAAVQQTVEKLDCQPCHMPVCRMRHHKCMRDIPAEQVIEVTRKALADARPA